MPAMSLSLNLTSGVAERGLTPPTLAPVLAVSAQPESVEAELAWTASNKTDSLGFGYRIFRDVSGNGFAELATTSSLFYINEAAAAAGELYNYYIEPYNDAGNGPSSNVASVVLPGLLPGE